MHPPVTRHSIKRGQWVVFAQQQAVGADTTVVGVMLFKHAAHRVSGMQQDMLEELVAMWVAVQVLPVTW